MQAHEQKRVISVNTHHSPPVHTMLLGLLIQILPLSTSYTHTQKDNSTFALSEANAFEEAFDGAEGLAAAAERAGVANRRMLKNGKDKVHPNPMPGGEPGGVVWAKGGGR